MKKYLCLLSATAYDLSKKLYNKAVTSEKMITYKESKHSVGNNSINGILVWLKQK